MEIFWNVAFRRSRFIVDWSLSSTTPMLSSCSTEISIFPPVRIYIYIYSAPGSNPLAFTFVHSSSLPFYDLSITTTPRKKRSTPELLNSGDKIHRITGRFTFIFIELTLPFVKLSSIVFFFFNIISHPRVSVLRSIFLDYSKEL